MDIDSIQNSLKKYKSEKKGSKNREYLIVIHERVNEQLILNK